MKHFSRFSLLLFCAFISSVNIAAEKTPVDQLPMYGGIDRNSYPELKQADEDLIAKAVKGFGGRDEASKAWVERGFRLYNQNDYETAMKRFNQAWLLNPKNPDVYFGFGSVLHDRGDNCGAFEMLEKAYSLGVNDAGFLADLGRVSTLCAVSKKSEKEKKMLITKSEELYKTAIRQAPNEQTKAYVLSSWASANYWQEDYASAWGKVHEVENMGGRVPPRFRELLLEKMDEPE